MELLSNIFGWVGMILILIAFYLVSNKKVEPNSKPYQLMNLFGAIGIVINTYFNQAWPAMMLNVVWALIAIKTLFQNRQNLES